MNNKSNPSVVYDIVKVLTLFLVVLAHSTRMYTTLGAFSPVNQSAVLAKITEFIYTFHMPLYIFISGSVYGLCIQMGKYTDNSAFLLSKAKRLIIPFCFFGFFYVAPVMRWTGLTQLDYLSYCFRGIILAFDTRHLWFLEALFWIYVFSIVIRKWLITSHKSRFIVLIATICVHFLAQFMPALFQLNAAFTYHLYFVIGAIFHFYYENMVAFFSKINYLWFALPAILIINICCILNFGDSWVYELIGIVMILMLSLFLEQRTHLERTKWFQTVKHYSMGIYLFHPMIIYLAYFWLGSKDLNPILLSIGVASISFFLSIVFTKVFRLCRVSFLLGE